MRKPTSIIHYGAGVVAALVLFFYSIPIGIVLIAMFCGLEVWDALIGHPSWGDAQEFILAIFIVSTLVLALSTIAKVLMLLGVI